MSKRLVASLIAVVAATASGAQTSDLRGDGAFDAVSIAGFVIPIDDVDRLGDAGVLTLTPQSTGFRFSDRITSERQLGLALDDLPLQNPRAIADMYRVAKVPLPNGNAHTLTIPSGFGPARLSTQQGRFTLGVGLSGVSRVPYTDEADGGIAFGLSFGNAFETLGGTLGLSINDLSDVTNTDRMSFGFELSRYVSDGLSVSVGGENLLIKVTDGEASYYMSASWAFDAHSSVFPFDGVATLGVGSGRFAHKTARDAAEGRGSDGTIVFGALAWEMNENLNLIADWNGRNLSMGAAFRIPDTDISVKLGLRDLTNNTGDGARIAGSIGYTIARF